MASKKYLNLMLAGITITGLMPIFLFWFFVGRAPAISSVEARRLLMTPAAGSLLVDVRTAKEFEQGHIAGAVNWPLADILKLSSPADIVEPFVNRILIFICDAGMSSSQAVNKVQGLTPRKVFHVQGGIQKWVEKTSNMDAPYFRFELPSGTTQLFPIRQASFFEQLAACTAAFAVKPLYMILSLLLIVVLRRQTDPDLKALKWAFVFFLAGEGFCAVNYMLFHEDSYYVEYLHILGMVAAFGLTTYAVIQFFDLRLLHSSDLEKRCAAISICPACIKYHRTPCGFIKILEMICIALIIIGFFPLLAGIHLDSYNTDIFGTFYNYTHPAVFQYFEIRYAPLLSMFFFAAALMVFIKQAHAHSETGLIMFCAGAGFLGFSMFRLVIFAVFRDNQLWYIVWEEITELLYAAGMCAFLFIFRKRLFEPKAEKTV